MRPDETLVRWGLHHLLGFSNQQHCPIHSAQSDHSLQDDEALARSLQESYYSEDSYVCNECANETNYFNNYATTQEVEATGSSSSHSSPKHHHSSPKQEVYRTPSPPPVETPASPPPVQNSMSSSYENDEAIAAALSEEFARLDGVEVGEVRRRLTHMESIPHVPRINRQFPSADDASLDHERLIERLHVYGLQELKISGDGNCQFRALSDQLYSTPDHHMFVRTQIVNQLKRSPERYQGYVPMDYSDYVKKMAKNGEWGDHVTLQAAADVYGMKICLITSFRDTCIIDIAPQELRSERGLFLSFWAEIHYNSVHPEGGIVL